MTTPYAGSNITGTGGAHRRRQGGQPHPLLRSGEPAGDQELRGAGAGGARAGHLARPAAAFVPLYGDGIYGSNKKPNNKILVIDLKAQALADVIPLGESRPRTAWWPPRTASCGWWRHPQQADRRRSGPARDRGGLRLPVQGRAPDGAAARRNQGLRLLQGGRPRRLRPPAPDVDRQRAVRAPGVKSGNGSGSEGVMPTPAGDRLIVIDNANNDLRVIDTPHRHRGGPRAAASPPRPPTRSARASPS